MNTPHDVSTQYDVIVVGARCAGSTTAMLLARQGHRVLLLDRATFPSDAVSTHIIHAPGVAALDRWGVLDRVLATGCPPIPRYTFDFGFFTLSGSPRQVGGHSAAFAPRRYLLDKILVDVAAEAGVEVREGYNVDDVVIENGVVTGVRGHREGGEPETITARVVVGADGRGSHVARAVGAETYQDRGKLQYAYYTYFRGLPVDEMHAYIRPDRGFAVAPTNDGLSMVVVGWPYAERAAYKADVEGNFLATLELAPEFAARVRAAERVAPFLGGAVQNEFRTPFGPGWVLVGDAGYVRDPITAQGITDAFRDAEDCSTALSAWLNGDAGFDEGLAAWQASRDATVLPMFEFTTQLAGLEPPPPEMQQLLLAVSGSQTSMDGFASLFAGTLPATEFFSPDNVGAIMRAA